MSSIYQEVLRGAPAGPKGSLGEILPRIAMLEEAVRGRRVLEVDAVEIAGLLRLSDAGAARVAATTARPERFSVASLRGRRIELVAMETGRIDFEDGSFDLAIVSDLARARTANPRFLDDLSRVLEEGAAALFVVPAGQPGLEQLTHELRSRFNALRFFRQVPFFGVTLVDEGADPETASVTLDASLAGPSPEASHIVLLAGHLEPAPDGRTLVELPLTEFLALTGGQEADRRRESELMRVELRQLKAELDRKDRSLKDVSERLRPLRAAIETRLHELDEEKERLREARSSLSPQVAQTIIEPAPPVAVEVEAARAALEATEEGLNEKTREVELLVEKLKVRDEDVLALESEVSQLRARLANPVGGQDLSAARRVIARLEQTTGEQERRIHELERELETQARLQHGLGSDYRDAESRIGYLQSRLEGVALERAGELKDLTLRLGALTQALGQSDQDRELLKERVLTLEAELHEARARADRAESESERLSRRARGELESARQQSREVEGVRDEARQLARENAQLERQLLDQARILDELRAQSASLSAQKTMLELAAAQATADVETLRRRVQELRNDRDTLAATSELLLAERDEARKVARRALGVEQEAIELARAKETLAEALRRALAERDESTEAQEGLRAQVADLEELRRRLVSELEAALGRAGAAEGQLEGARQRVKELDQRLAELQTRASADADRTESSDRERDALHEVLRDASLEARQAKIELSGYVARVQSLEESARQAEQAIGEALANRAKAEAELISVSARLSETDAQRVRAVAQAAVLRDRLTKLAEEADKKLAEAEQTQRGLGETLRNTAELTTQIAAMEEALAASRSREADLKDQLANTRASAEQGMKLLSAKLAELEEQKRSAGEVIRFVEDSVAKLARKEEAIEVFRAWAELAARHIRHLERALGKARAAARLRPAESAPAAEDPIEFLRHLHLEDALVSSEARATELADENLRLQAAFAQAEEARRRLLLEQRAKDDEISIASAVLLALREREAELRAHVRDLSQALEEERLRAAEADARAAELAQRLAALDLEVENLRLGYTSAQEAVRAADRLHEDLETSLFARVSELEDRLALRTTELDSEAARHATASARLVEIQDQCQRLERALAEREATIGRMETAVSEGEEQVRAELVTAQETVRGLQDELVRSKHEAEHERAGLEARVATATRRSAELESELAQLRQALEAERRDTEHRLAEAETARAALAAELDSRGPSATEAEAKQALLEAQRQRAEARAMDAESKLERLETRASTAEARAMELEAKSVRAEERADRAEKTAMSLEAASRQAEETALASKVEVEALRVEHERRLQELREGKSRVADLETRGRELELKLKGLEAEMRLSEDRAKKAELRAQDAQQAMAESARRIAELEAVVADTQRRARSEASSVQLTAAREELEQLRAKLLRAEADLRARPPSQVPGTSPAGLAAVAPGSIEALEQALKQRQTEAERLRSAAIRTAQDLDEARAEVGRRLVDLSAKESALEQKERENAALNEHLEVLKAKLARQGDADLLAGRLRESEQEVARYVAQKSAQQAEIDRLRSLLQRSEEAQVQLELKAAELETQAAESQRKVELLQRDVAEKSERLRRMTDLGDTQ